MNKKNIKNRVIHLLHNNLLQDDDLSTFKEMAYDALYDKIYKDDLTNTDAIECRLFRFVVEHNIPISFLGTLEDDDLTVFEAIEDILNYIVGDKICEYAHLCVESINEDIFYDELEYKTNIYEYI